MTGGASAARIRLAAALLAALLTACGAEPEPRSRLILLALDGGALPVLEEGIAAGRLPNFARLAREGALGGLASIRADLPFSPERGNGFWSPLVWNSVATGKEPAVHGVLDFRLPPRDGYRLCTLAGAAQARLRLEPGPRAHSLAILRAQDAEAGSWGVRSLSGDGAELPLLAGETRLPLEAASGEQLIEFRPTRRDAPRLCLRELQLLDAGGSSAGWIHFFAQRAAYRSGWAEPRHGPLGAARSDHRRVRALWNIASEAGRRVAVVGWRDSWPAETVNGYYVSDRLGLRFASGPSVPTGPRFSHPPALAARLQPLLERAPEVDAQADRTLLAVAPCELAKQNAAVARVSYWGDWLRQQIALQLWDADPQIDFLALYFRGVDAFGHMFQYFREPRSQRCHVEPPLVDRYYAVVDGFLGAWLGRLGEDTRLLVVTDHGMHGEKFKGEHEDNGFFLLGGPGVKAGSPLQQAHVLDVAPTALQLLGLPLAEDMPGRPLAAAPRAANPPAPVASYESRPAPTIPFEADPESEAAVLERLRALGYLDPEGSPEGPAGRR